MKKELTPEQTQNRKKWIEALRSSTYQQGFGHLKQKNNDCQNLYCCLGVAAENYGVIWNEAHLDFPIRYGLYLNETNRFSTYTLPTYLLENLGLDIDEQRNLIAANDSYKFTFAQIADLLESGKEITHGLITQNVV